MLHKGEKQDDEGVLLHHGTAGTRPEQVFSQQKKC